MYRNLEAELARNMASRKDVAKIIGCSVGTVSQKMHGKSFFTIPEAKALQKFLGGDKPIEYLFATEEENVRSANQGYASPIHHAS